MRWEERKLSELATAVRELDDELSDQKVELTLHGAAIKQLLEAAAYERTDRQARSEHSWQIKLLGASVLITEAVQVFTTVYHR